MNVSYNIDEKFLTMKQFRSMVDKQINAIAGLGIDDLPDFDLWNYYDEELNLSDKEWKELAVEAANDLLAQEQFPFE